MTGERREGWGANTGGEETTKGVFLRLN